MRLCVKGKKYITVFCLIKIFCMSIIFFCTELGVFLGCSRVGWNGLDLARENLKFLFYSSINLTQNLIHNKTPRIITPINLTYISRPTS